MSNYKINFSTNLTLELKHVDNNIEVRLLQTPKANQKDRILLAVKHIPKTELQACIQHQIQA